MNKNIVIAFLLGAVIVAAGFELNTLYGSSSRWGSQAVYQRDSIRVSDLHKIRYALDEYYSIHHAYPTCLYKADNCPTALEGSLQLPIVPLDPLTNDEYSYAGNGTGSVCSAYHLGTSLENNQSPFMVLGSDAPVRTVCTGSNPDFSGLSYAPGGQPCNAQSGIAQPTDDSHGESCYDLTK